MGDRWYSHITLIERRTMANPNGKTDVDFWERSGNSTIPSHVSSGFQQFFDTLLPKGRGRTAIEVGTCPGNNLAALVRSHDYRPYAIDILPAVRELAKYFERNDLAAPVIFSEDFLEWASPTTFDVVMSFGFIEHFENWREVLAKHWQLLKPGGYLMVGVPILGFLQFWLRNLVYTRKKLTEVLAAHNLDAMDLGRLTARSSPIPMRACSSLSIFGTWIRRSPRRRTS